MTYTNTGFTIIEVLIVVGISAALASTIIIWQGSFSENARFIDAMDSLQSDLNQERRQVYAVVNQNSDSPGSDTGRVQYGKALEFSENDGEVTVHTLVAGTVGDVFEDQEIGSIEPVGEMERQIEMKWGLEFLEGDRNSTNVDTIAFVRDFDSEELMTYTMNFESITDVDAYNVDAQDQAVFRFVTPEDNEAQIYINENVNSLRRSFD